MGHGWCEEAAEKINKTGDVARNKGLRRHKS